MSDLDAADLWGSDDGLCSVCNRIVRKDGTCGCVDDAVQSDALAAAQLAVVSAAMDEWRAEGRDDALGGEYYQAVGDVREEDIYATCAAGSLVDAAGKGCLLAMTAARRLACEALAKIEEAQDAG